jgi:uncharacterized membrane protein
MPGWLTDFLYAIINTVPALLVAQDSPHFMLARTMFVLIFIVLIVCALVGLPSFWSAAVRHFRKPSTPDHA